MACGLAAACAGMLGAGPHTAYAAIVVQLTVLGAGTGVVVPPLPPQARPSVSGAAGL